MLSIRDQLGSIVPIGLTGSVTKLVGMTASVASFPAPLGAVCHIQRENRRGVDGEVIGFQRDETLVLPYGDLSGIRRGNHVSLKQSVSVARVGDRLLGRVLDGRGRFLDDRPDPILPKRVNLIAKPTPAMQRPRIDAPLATGVRAIDGLLTCGKGQRLGIFSASGVGKSMLLGQMARSSTADVNVVVLVGERGREVREFLERDLGPDALSRSVVVAATSEEPALVRLRAAHLGSAIAEYVRDTGRDVLLMMDSVTRYALALREIGLAAGEPPAARGFPPSVFALLPRLLERSGRADSGSITGFYTVLVEADDHNEPISDSVRGILDGHLVLSRQLAEHSHWPAIDVLASVSRSMKDVVSDEHLQAADRVRHLLSAYQQSEDLISLGAYQSGSNPRTDVAIRLREPILKYLCQTVSQRVSFSDSVNQLRQLARLADEENQKTIQAAT